MFNRFGERVREGTGWIGDLNTGNGTPGSRLGPVDDNDDYDYHPGNGRGNGPNKETSVQTTDQTSEENLVTEEAGTEGVEEETVTQDITTDLVKENPYRYSHYYYDRKTQFYYLQARYYNPRIGRFISMDPWRGEITNPLSLNRYVYAYNNPVNYVDPTGYMAWYQPLYLIIGIGQSGLDSIVDLLLSGKHMYDFSKALVQGKISFKGILSSVANGFKEPFVYLVNNGKKVWLDKPSSPSNKEVREYGRQLGHSLQIIIGSAALAAVGVKIISKGSKAVGTALQKLAKESGNQKRKPNNYSSNDISNKYAKNDNQGNLYGANNKSTKGGRNGNVTFINPNEIRFSQSSVNGAKEITESMKKNGWNGSPIDVVRMPDGKLSTVDNTRVLAAKNAGIDVQAVVRNANDPIPLDMAQRFISKNGVIPKTWGEAVNNRINNQNSSYRTTHSNGSFITGWDGR